jgi:hypothetical protein
MYPGHVHISPALTQLMESARAWRSEVLTVLKNAHAGLPVTTDVTSATVTSD